MNKTGRFCSTILIGALFIVGSVFSVVASAADQNPCSEDIAKFCKNIKAGQPALMECLERYESQLSDACKDYEAKMEKPRVESREAWWQQMRVRQACKEDVTKFCNDVKLGSGGIATCLKEHTAELSIPCRDAVQAARGGEEERKAK